MNKDTDVLIIGGGLAGLSVGCYAQMNGWRAHVLEHDDELGGVCTSWRRGDYVVDGCVRWLQGAGEGELFHTIYEELGVTRDVTLKSIELFHQYEDPANERVVVLGNDASAYRDDLLRLSPADGAEIDRLLEAASKCRDLPWPVNRPPELTSVLDRFRALWDVRALAGTLLHFRGSVGEWSERHLSGAPLRDYFESILASETPMIILPFLLNSVLEGAMARPIGGSGALRDAIVDRYEELGGEVSVRATVDEILIEKDRAVGVRLADGTHLRAEHIVSTASPHETFVRLLGGRFLGSQTRERLDEWRSLAHIALFSAGVALPLDDAPPTLVIRQSDPLWIGKVPSQTLSIRVYNDEPSFAPEGRCVIQTEVNTDYQWWAELRDDYASAKRRTADEVLSRIDRRLPGVADAVEMLDLATPLSFWRHSRSHGLYEGWIPTRSFRARPPKGVPGVANLHIAGQWVEPIGGVSPTLASGRQLVQLLCSENHREFTTSRPERQRPAVTPIDVREKTRETGTVSPLGRGWSP